jgi:hypothetical protein
MRIEEKFRPLRARSLEKVSTFRHLSMFVSTLVDTMPLLLHVHRTCSHSRGFVNSRILMIRPCYLWFRPTQQRERADEALHDIRCLHENSVTLHVQSDGHWLWYERCCFMAVEDYF